MNRQQTISITPGLSAARAKFAAKEVEVELTTLEVELAAKEVEVVARDAEIAAKEADINAAELASSESELEEHPGLARRWSCWESSIPSRQ